MNKNLIDNKWTNIFHRRYEQGWPCKHISQIIQKNGHLKLARSYPEEQYGAAANQASKIFRMRRPLREIGISPGSAVMILTHPSAHSVQENLIRRAVTEEGGRPMSFTGLQMEQITKALEENDFPIFVGCPFMYQVVFQNLNAPHANMIKVPDKAVFTDLALGTQWHEKSWRRPPFLALHQYSHHKVGPIASECQHQRGLHVHSDYVQVKLVDLETQQPVCEPNQSGEIVIIERSDEDRSHITSYATGDIAAWLDEKPCSCGRTTPRLGPVLGRKEHQFTMSGARVYADTLLESAQKIQGVNRTVLAIKEHKGECEAATLLVATNREIETSYIAEQLFSSETQIQEIPLKIEYVDLKLFQRIDKSVAHLASSFENRC